MLSIHGTADRECEVSSFYANVILTLVRLKADEILVNFAANLTLCCLLRRCADQQRSRAGEREELDPPLPVPFGGCPYRSRPHQLEIHAHPPEGELGLRWLELLTENTRPDLASSLFMQATPEALLPFITPTRTIVEDNLDDFEARKVKIECRCNIDEMSTSTQDVEQFLFVTNELYRLRETAPRKIATHRCLHELLWHHDVLTTGADYSWIRKSTAFTNREKSVRLLRRCSSWTQLEETDHKRSHFDLQEPAISVRLGVYSSEHFIPSLRRTVLENGEATPFQSSIHQDYFTVGSLALDLLRDADSMQHLWIAFGKIDDDTFFPLLGD